MKETIEVMRCDGCGKTIPMYDTDPVLGYHGTVVEHGTWGGGYGGQWFACRERCIKAAVLEAIDRSRRDDQ